MSALLRSDWLDRHRGPFKFHVTRPGKKAGHVTGEWVKGTVDKDDVEGDALALLSDRRDDITHVGVWSLREQQFVHTYTERDARRAAKKGRAA